MPMSQDHKDALARGRKESRAIKSYLQALSNRRPGRPVTPDSLRNRIDRVSTRLESESDPLRRVDLLQQKIDAESQLADVEKAADLATLESGFVDHAKGYSDRKGISYAAWREAGVSAAVLRKAGIARGS